MAPVPTHNRYAVLADEIIGELATPDRGIVRSADTAKKRRNHCVREWLVDTGASYDMVDSNVMFNRKDVVRDSSGPVLKTAAGAKRAQQRANLTLPEMGEKYRQLCCLAPLQLYRSERGVSTSDIGSCGSRIRISRTLSRPKSYALDAQFETRFPTFL